MAVTMPFASYDPVTKTVHWVIAGAFLVMFLTAFAMGSDADLFDPAMRKAIYTTHKTTGFFILCLMLFRVFWGHHSPPPSLGMERFPRWQAIAARFVHDSLYTLALVTPFIGWALVSMGPYGLKLFGVIEIPPVPAMDFFKGSEEMKDFVSEFHETLATILACLLVVHVGATFLHHFVDRDEILLRMTPKCTHSFLEKLRGN